MKNKIRFLVMMLIGVLLSVNQVWGETATIDFDTNQAPSGTSFTSTSGTITNVLSFSCAKNSSSTDPAYNTSDKQLRLYYATSGDGGSITITAASGVTFSAFEFASTTTPTIKYSVDGGAKTSISYIGGTDPKRYSVSNLNCSSITLQNCSTSSTQLRFKYITVTYSSGSSRTCNVTWMVNGEEYTIGSPTVEVTGGNRVTTLPTPPTISCGELVFDGWSASTISGESNSAPTDLFSTADAAPIVTGDVTYHAVFTSGGFNRGASSNITDNGKIVLVDDDNYALSSVIEKENSCYYWTYPILVNGSHLSCPPASCVWTTEEATNSKWYLKYGDKYLNLYDQYDDDEEEYYSCTYIDSYSDAWNFTSAGDNIYTLESTNSEEEPYLYVYSDNTFGGSNSGTDLQIYVYTSGVWVTTCDTKIPLSAPTNLSAGTPTSHGITLSWTAVEHAGSYTLEYKVSSADSWTTISSITTTSYNLTGLTPETTYAWRLTAVPSDATTYSNSNTVNGSNFTTSSITYTDISLEQKSGQFQPFISPFREIVILGFFAFFCKKVFHIRCTEGAWRMHIGSRPSSQPLFLHFGTLFAQPPFFLIYNVSALFLLTISPRFIFIVPYGT